MKYLFLILFSIVLVACGSSHHSLPSGNDLNSCQYTVYRHSDHSWLLKNPEPHFDFWGDWTANQSLENSIINDWLQLISNDGVFDRLAEYGIYQGNPDPILYNSTNDVSGLTVAGNYDAGGWKLLDDQKMIVNLQTHIQLNHLPYPNDNTIYVIMLPAGYATQTMLDHHWTAYHHYSNYNGQRFAFAFITFGSEDQINVVISHELSEAATNPDDHGFYEDTSGNEIGDLCEGGNNRLDNILVQKVWSQDLCVCE